MGNPEAMWEGAGLDRGQRESGQGVGKECCDTKGAKGKQQKRCQQYFIPAPLHRPSPCISRRKGNKKRVSDKCHGAQAVALRREAERKQMFQLREQGTENLALICGDTD